MVNRLPTSWCAKLFCTFFLRERNSLVSFPTAHNSLFLAQNEAAPVLNSMGYSVQSTHRHFAIAMTSNREGEGLSKLSNVVDIGILFSFRAKKEPKVKDVSLSLSFSLLFSLRLVCLLSVNFLVSPNFK